MSHHTWTRPILIAFILATSWLVAGGSTAHAAVAPDPEGPGLVTRTLPALPVEGTPLWQYALIAGLACLVTLVATLAVQAIRHHGHPSRGFAHG